MERFTNAVGAIAFLGSVGVVSFIAITRAGATADTALGALLALTSAGAGYFLRGRVQAPDKNGAVDDNQVETAGVLLRASGPSVATIRTTENDQQVETK